MVGTATAVTNAADISGVEIVNVRNVGTGVAALDASTITGLTDVNSDRSTGTLTITNLASGAKAGMIGNGTVVNGALNVGYATATDAATLNISGGTKGGAVAITSTPAAVTVNSTGAANTLTSLALGGAATGLTVNATTALDAGGVTGFTGTAAKITVAGAAANIAATATAAEKAAVVLGTIEASTVKTLDASGLTAGGVSATLNTAITSFKGGLGNDTITTAATTATGAVIDAGAGTADTLVLAATNDVTTTAKGAQYTNFEVLKNQTTAAVNTALIAGITAVESAAAGGGFTNLTATQAAAVTNSVDQTAITYSLATATGTADVLSVTLKNTTATASADLAGATVNGFETLNITSSSGAKDAGTVAAATAAANIVSFAAATDLTAITLAGDYGVNLILDKTSKAVTVTNTLAGTADMRVEGEVKKGSSITATANNDAIETALAAVAGVSGDFVTYNAGAGDDAISTSLTALNNTNNAQASLKIDGGAGTDTLTFANADATFVDAHFQYVTGVEKIVLTNTTTTSVTSGGFFDANFKASGVDLETGTIANGATGTINLASFTGNAKVKLTSSGDGATVDDNISVTTGSGNDDVTVAATSWVGAAAAGGAYTITTGAGDDKITFSAGTILATGGITINAGKGADTISATSVHADSTGVGVTYVIADGDSLAAARDKITGFDLGTVAKLADTLDLEGTPTVTANTTGMNGTDSGTIKSHAITSGIITFDDADSFATAVVVNQTNLSDVLTYLATNIVTTGEVVAFAYDSDNSGTADATIVFQQGTSDTVVELVGVVGTSITATNAATAGLIDLA